MEVTWGYPDFSLFWHLALAATASTFCLILLMLAAIFNKQIRPNNRTLYALIASVATAVLTFILFPEISTAHLTKLGIIISGIALIEALILRNIFRQYFQLDNPSKRKTPNDD
jgi:hypothetical protein